MVPYIRNIRMIRPKRLVPPLFTETPPVLSNTRQMKTKRAPIVCHTVWNVKKVIDGLPICVQTPIRRR
ncbi:MAG: hypothetical protein K0Q59_933 [Paenibacillus sp.]|nr:hypothetical protein [Paenibacillus sp.]